ncbi:MAG: nickel pincer cofactor biosynthesis protein LarB [Actinomycetota bacterium]
MRPEEVKDLLTGMRDGTTTVEDAFRALRNISYDDIGIARLDTHRELRQGLPEAIYAEHKTPGEVVAIAERLLERSAGPVLATRVTPETVDALQTRWPEAAHHSAARLVVLRADVARRAELGTVAVVSGGTADGPIADEAFFTSQALGLATERIADVGIAGVHRVLAVQDRLHDAACVIVVAGMEGALASLVGGITAAPVVAVPTSVGYGASFEGLAALLAMLNSCAAGVVVTNIDNGFGAAVFALRMLLKGAK